MMSRMWHTHQGSIMWVVAISIRRGRGIMVIRLSRILTMMRLMMMLGWMPRIMSRVVRLSQMPVTMMGMIIMMLCRRIMGIGHMMCPRIVVHMIWMALLMMIRIRLSLRRR